MAKQYPQHVLKWSKANCCSPELYDCPDYHLQLMMIFKPNGIPVLIYGFPYQVRRFIRERGRHDVAMIGIRILPKAGRRKHE